MTDKEQGPMSDERLEEIAQQYIAATDGHWIWRKDYTELMAVLGNGDEDEVIDTIGQGGEINIWPFDAEFVARAHQDIPDLLAEVKRLRDENQEFKILRETVAELKMGLDRSKEHENFYKHEANNWQRNCDQWRENFHTAVAENKKLETGLTQCQERAEFWQREASKLGWRGTLDATK